MNCSVLVLQPGAPGCQYKNKKTALCRFFFSVPLLGSSWNQEQEGIKAFVELIIDSLLLKNSVAEENARVKWGKVA